MMAEGERQVAPTLEGIRRDHVARYEWAAKLLPTGVRVIDFACGVGYGTKILSDAGLKAIGFDISAEAIKYAKEHYQGIGQVPEFVEGNGCDPSDLPEVDAAVCFETIEHIEDPRPLLKALRETQAQMLLASVPNESVMPFKREDGSTTAFHHRHYLQVEFQELLEECGWKAIQWHGQAGPESEVEPNVNGRTIIAVCERGELPGEERQRKHVAILGLGPSVDEFLNRTKRIGGRWKFCDEVWAINALGNVFQCDLVFHMDDVRIQEIRAKARPESNIAAMLQWIKRSPVPIVTSRAHSDYPALVEFPLQDVLNNLGHDYFNSTAAYAVAFAIHVGATEISAFGMDFTYENSHHAEKGRACVEFWLGQAHARGIKINLPKHSILLDANCERRDRLYGYDTLDVKFHMQPDGQLLLELVPRETLPTADEIEAKYDHTKPIPEQHVTKK
jgi:protein-L-isoaspartate O-methyltransferase